MNIDLSEIIRYMGGKLENTDNLLLEKIEESIKIFKEKVIPKSEYIIVDIGISKDTVKIHNTDILLKSSDLTYHLASCSKAIILLTTLGVSSENLLRKSRMISSLDELIFNSISNHVLDLYNDSLCEKFERIYNTITTAYGAGYGDLSLSYQGDILSLLSNKLMVGINANNILSPKKTTLSIIGINPKNTTAKNCSNCSMSSTCNYRKEN